MSVVDDINPDFITALPVSKQEMRNQLQHIKNLLNDLSAASGWRILSSQFVSVAAGEVRFSLPPGYSRYRLDFQDVRFAVDGVLCMRMSTNDGASYITSGYQGNRFEYNNSTSGAASGLDGGSTAFNITGIQLAAQIGAYGTLDFVAQRNVFKGDVVYITSSAVRNHRLMNGAYPAAEVNNVVFFPQGSTTTFAVGSRFTLMVCE